MNFIDSTDLLNIISIYLERTLNKKINTIKISYDKIIKNLQQEKGWDR